MSATAALVFLALVFVFRQFNEIADDSFAYDSFLVIYLSLYIYIYI